MTTRGQTAGHPSDRAHAEQIRARVSEIQLAAALPARSALTRLCGARAEKDHTQIVSCEVPGLLQSILFALSAAFVPALCVLIVRLNA
jgi:hypothetical protein